MLMLSLSNTGLNLWAVERAFIGLNPGQATYETPPGTLDVLNVVFSQPTIVASTFAANATGGTSVIAAEAIRRVGFALTSAFVGEISVASGGVTLVTLSSQSYSAGSHYWVELPVATSAADFSVESLTAPYPVVSAMVIVSSVYDLPCSQWNRDTYAALNNKAQANRPSTSYFYEKKLVPTITLWPVPTTNTDHLTVYRHRQPQDVGSLSETLEIPQRWLDGVIWMLASRLCFELPSVDANLAQLIVQMADQQVLQMSASETDGAPIYLTPGIGVYNR